jgi:hypothetical protein
VSKAVPPESCPVPRLTTEYQKGTVISKNALEALFDQVIERADMLCTTPAMTESIKGPYIK